MNPREATRIPARLVRFGTYEADLTENELRKGGHPVRLQDKPFQILAALIDRAGEVVTRDELRERLWPGESFGEFDQGLNTAINKLREALGDSAANPRYIETLPRRGYRFIHPLETPLSNGRQDTVVHRPSLPAKSVVVVAAVLGIAALLWTRQPAPDPELPLRRFTLRASAANTFTPNNRLVAVSPNGRHVAIVAGDGKSKLWVQDLDKEQPRPVEGSEGALSPFWSPDSTVIAFTTSRKLKRVSITGGPAIPICDTEGAYISGGSWSPDGASIVFTAGAPSAMYTVAATGGTARLLLSPQMMENRPGWIAHPHFLPAEGGASAILFTHFGSIVSLMALDVKTGRHHVMGSGSSPSYSATGHLLYRSGTDLWARAFVPQRAQFSGEPFRVARNATDPSAASDGTLVYRDLVTEQLVWVDRHGAEVGNIQLPANGVYYPAISPDGRRVAAEAWEQDNLDVWISDTGRGARTRLTSHPATEVVPVWSPDGEEVAFSSYRAGNTDIFIRRADAGSDEVRLTSAREDERASDWSRDGQYILYSLLHAKNGTDLWYLKRNAGGKWEPHPFLETSFNEQTAKLSPDGRYVAYLSDESGRDEVYVREFPSGVHKWPVSSVGASQVRWSRSGRELFYVVGGTLISVSVRTAPRFEVGRSTRLFSHSALTVWRDPDYDVSPDGQRFILPQPVGTHPPMIHLVQNWFTEFRVRR